MEAAQLHVARERITKLFQFLEAFNQLRNPVVRHIERSAFSLWLDELPEHPAVTVGWHDAEAEFVLSVGRPVLTDCPVPPPSIAPWLRPGWMEVEGIAAVIESRPRPLPPVAHEAEIEGQAAVEPPPERFDDPVSARQ